MPQEKSYVEKLWNKVKHSATRRNTAFAIPASHVVEPSLPSSAFCADEAYFELRVSEEYLADRREWWTEFNPLTVVFGEFLYDDKKQVFPFVVGPKLLAGLESNAPTAGDSVTYKGTRVVGPTPYKGDQVAIYVGLYRVKVKDWAQQALSLLESVAKVFDTSKLSKYVDIATPLTNGIEGFFGMGQDMEFRLGQYQALADPSNSSAEGAAPSVPFTPGYFVLIHDQPSNIRQDEFWVKGGELRTGSDGNHLALYGEHDYVLYQLTCLGKRNDYTTFDFHKQWEDVQSQIQNGNDAKAIEGYQHLIAMIRRSPDLIPSQMNQLALMYRAKYQEERAQFDLAKDPMAPVVTIAQDEYARSLQNLENMKVSKDVIRAISKSNDLFGADVSRSFRSRRARLTESVIKKALDSPAMRDDTVTLANTDALTAALSMEMPIR